MALLNIKDDFDLYHLCILHLRTEKAGPLDMFGLSLEVQWPIRKQATTKYEDPQAKGN